MKNKQNKHLFQRTKIFKKWWVGSLGFMIILSGCGQDKTYVVLEAGQVYVGRSDNLYSLASRHDVSVRDLIEENNLKFPYDVEEGQVLWLPHQKTKHHPQEKARKEDKTSSSRSRQEEIPSGEGPVLLNDNDWEDVPLEGASGLHENAHPQDDKAKILTEGADAQNIDAQLLEEMKETENPSPSPALEEKHRKPEHQKKTSKKTPHSEKSPSSQEYTAPVSKEMNSSAKDLKMGIARFQDVKGEAVHACADGKVFFTGKLPGQDESIVLLQHKNGVTTVYFGVQSSVKAGQEIKKQDVIGKSSHSDLKVEFRNKRRLVNPKDYLK